MFPLRQAAMEETASLETIHYRLADERIFVNKSVDFYKIKAVGFDMDYTIAPYNDEYEKLQFDLGVENLVTLYHYPEEIKNFKYDNNFAVKGLFVDTVLGNILKIDQFGYVHVAMHGKRKLTDNQIKQCYKDKTIPINVLEQSTRYYLQSSAFAAPQITLYAWLIDYFEEKQALINPICPDEKVRRHYDNVSKIQKDQLNYSNLFADVSKAIGLVHGSKAKLKQITQKNPEKYIMKSANLSRMLRNLRKSGKITFLLTNSGFEYTDSVLVYLLGKEYK